MRMCIIRGILIIIMGFGNMRTTMYIETISSIVTLISFNTENNMIYNYNYTAFRQFALTRKMHD